MTYGLYCAVCGGPAHWLPVAEASRRELLKGAADLARQVGREFPESSGAAEHPNYVDPKFRGFEAEILNKEDVRWTRDVHVLGFNQQASAIDKAYIVELARYVDWRCVRVVVPGDDPNFPIGSEDGDLQCYQGIDATQPPRFPIHPPCFQLLTKALTGQEDAACLDKDIVYQIIADLSDGPVFVPDLNFGDPAPPHPEHGENRDYNLGDELTLVTPGRNSAFTILLRNTVSTDDFALPAPAEFPPDIASRIRSDIFKKLPYDITHQIMLMLPSETAVALCNASFSVHSSFGSSNRTFWRAAIHHYDETTDYKGLFLWLEKYTKPRKGLEGPFMGIANRRRIWGVCEQYAALYAPRVAAKARMHVADGEADRIWKGSKNLGVPVVIQPLPRKGLRTVTTQWITDIVQDTHRGGVLEAIWDVNRTLVGLAVTLTGKQRHVFGMDHGPNRTKEQVSLGEGCWIKSLVLHMPDMFLTERLETSIKGITFHTTKLEEAIQVGDTHPEYCQRLLRISDQHVLVGLEGHISSDNRICRLGLIQHPHFDIIQSFQSYNIVDSHSTGASKAPLLYQPLWKPPSASNTNVLHRHNAPIWSKNPRSLMAFPSCDRPRISYNAKSKIHDDVVPVDTFVWAANDTERRNLVRLTAFLYEGTHICCLRAEYTKESGIPAREAGNEAVRKMLALDRERPQKEAPAWWRNWAARMKTKHFEIDGPRGETVIRVQVEHRHSRKTIYLWTNKGRVRHLGDKNTYMDQSTYTDAPRGYAIVGFALGFSFSGDIVHRWEDGSGMVLRDQAQLAWLATLTLDEAWFA
ncbi:F-box domain-containing protein [Macrophomina phaseolina MS6]|uniref:F-box domain-containing protein n=1 Tax=Macrophomina phaseolina (strain MS6) TaxID=1126212 RepID=K2QK25_MACPH|nr:F-box domain-containing protein [Macrophomina phaseolina MS6]